VLGEIDKFGPGQAAPTAVKAPPEKAPSNLCPHCGANFPKPMKFCGECGKAMA